MLFLLCHVSRTVKSPAMFADMRERVWCCGSQMHTISRSTMDEVIEANKYLQLPRLSSQLFFNQLCPQSTDAHNRRQVPAPYIHCTVATIAATEVM